MPPKKITRIRAEINRVTQSRRMLAHGLATPQLGQADPDFMDLEASTLKVDGGAVPSHRWYGWVAG